MGTVHSIFGPKSEKTKEPTNKVDFDEIFEDAIKKNAENKKRIVQDQARANKSILRSHRIKD